MKLPRTTGIMAQAGARRCWGLLGAVVSIPLLVGPVGAQQTSAQAGGELAVKTVRQIEALLAAKEQRTPARRKGSSQLLPARQPEAYGVERRQAKGEVAEDETVMVSATAAAVTTCSGGMAGTYPCSNVDLMSFLALADIGGGEANDIWGWTDSSTGKEYAIMGRTTGTSFVDISDPVNPIYLGNLPPAAGESDERDIKVYADHAFIVAEADNSGMQVFDLTHLRMVASPPATFSETAHYPGFSHAHNLAINEDSGFAYAVGTNTCSGGLHMINIQTPTNPTSAGCFSGDGYTHDAQCVNYDGPDLDHQGREICFNSNEDTLTIVDVTNKADPVMLSRTGYSGSRYTHQGWLTEDQGYFLLDDELDEANNPDVTNTRTYMWNVSDLDGPALIGFHDSTTTAIDHNQYVKGSYTYQSNYQAGLRILDITDIANGNLTEVAFFDVYPGSDPTNTDTGTWSNYPFFDSGVVIVSVIEQGLFILRPNLVDGVDPALSSAAVNGPVLTLTYGEALDGSSIPATGDFTITVAGSERMVTHVSVSGRVVTLTLNPAVEHGDTGIRVSYSPGTNPIRDPVGNEAGALTDQEVDNQTPDTTAPTIEGIELSSDPGMDETYAIGDMIAVTVRFSETVTVDTTHGTPTLDLTVGNQSKPARYSPTPVSADVVFLYTVEDNDIDTDGVSIAAGRIVLNDGAIQDLADNPAALAYEEVPPQAGHKVDGVKPELRSATVDGAMLVLTYNEVLDEDSIPATSDFTVNVEGAERPLSQILVSESAVTLTLDSPAAAGRTVTVSYRAGTNPIRDAVGNSAEDLAEYPAKPPGPGGGGGLPPVPNPVPDAPRNLEALGGDEQVTLSWEAPEDDGGFPITDYEYLISGTGGGWISTGSTETTHTVTELTNGRVYLFQVRAVSAAGAGNSSHRVEVTPGVGRLEFAHFANGSSITSELVLVNVFARPIRPWLYFYDREGERIAVESVVEVTEELEVAQDGSLTVQTEMQPLEALTISTHGQGEVVAGSVTVLSNGPLGGVLRFDLPGVGVAGVGAGQPLRDALFPARRQAGGISTAAAIRNLEAEELVVSCQLMQEGAVLEEVDIELRANGQDGRFIEEVFTTTDTTDFVGLVRCTAPAGKLFAGVAVELDAGNGIFTTLPVLAVDRTVFRGGEYALDFAHFANGASITSDLVLVNVSIRPSRPAGPFTTPIPPTRPSSYFYDREGERIAAQSVVEVAGDLELAEDGSLTIQNELKPLQAVTISTHGQGEVVAGSVRVVAEGPIGGVLRFDLPGVGVAGVGAGQPLRDALFPARRREGGISTAAAIRNLEAEELVVSCRLMQEGEVLEEVDIELQANGQDGRFIEEMFTRTDTSDFVGLVRCTAEGEFAGVAVELDAANGIFTTLPVVPVQR